MTATLRAADEYPFLAVLMSEEALSVLRRLSPRQQDELLRRDERMVARVFAALDGAGVRPAVTRRCCSGCCARCSSSAGTGGMSVRSWLTR